MKGIFFWFQLKKHTLNFNFYSIITDLSRSILHQQYSPILIKF